MTNIRILPQLAMKRADLDNLLPLELPPGYALRCFEEGDQRAWEEIIAAAFDREDNPERFDELMKGDPAFRPERVLFITYHGEPARRVCPSVASEARRRKPVELVATAGAWHKPKFGMNTGYMHMVGVSPAHRGKRLGYWVNMAALHQFVAEGRTCAMLHTDDYRLAAIKTYLRLGFEPHIVHENQPERWKRVLATLNWRL